VAASDWLGLPVVNDSCRMILVMAAKRQKLSENIEFSSSTVAGCTCQTKRAPVEYIKKGGVFFFLESFNVVFSLPEIETMKLKKH
jgi:hypothetical protein